MRNRLIKDILNQAEKVAHTPSTVVIVGEYGSGKSWLAHRIHNLSNRSDQSFIPVNCYTMREDEAKDEIFGYLSFTDTGVKLNKGVLEKCSGGTLFFKGFDSFPEQLQIKIINSVKEKKTFHRGSQNSVPVNAHVIISIDIKAFYNSQAKYNLLKTVLDDDHNIIFHPPLRHRRDEIAYLIDSFLKDELSHRYDFASREISPRAIYLCIRYDWPGNVKQLKNAIEHAAVISAGNSIQPEHLPLSIKSGQPREEKMDLIRNDVSFQAAEKKLLLSVMKNTNSKNESARLLGLEVSSLNKKISKYNLVNEHSN